MSWWHALFIACGFFTAGFALCAIMVEGKSADKESDEDYRLMMLRTEIKLLTSENAQLRSEIANLSHRLLNVSGGA